MKLQIIYEQLTIEQRRIFLEKWNKVKNTEYAETFIDNVSRKVNQSDTPNWNKLEAAGRIALKKVDIGSPIKTKAPVLTHKAYCIKCGRDSFISWFDYPDVSNKQLGCSICKTKIDVHQSYSINK